MTLERAAFGAFLLLVAALPWTIAPMSIGVAFCGALTLAAWWRPGGARWVRTPVDLPALAWLLALILATVFSADPSASAPRITKGLLFAIVPVAAYHARDPRRARVAMAVLLVSIAAATLYAWIEFAARGSLFPNRVRGAVGHPLTYGGQAMLFASLATAFAFRAPGAWKRAGWALLALLIPALLFSFTRSAWLGWLLALGIVLAATRTRWLVASAAAVAVAVAVLAALLPGVYRERVVSIADPRSPWNVERVHMWRAGIRMLADRPVTGLGLQDLRPAYERYKDPDARERVGHLHSVWFHVAATMGAVGLGALIFLFAGLGRAAASGLRRRLRAPPERDAFDLAVQLGVAAGLAGFILAGAFEWNLGDEELIDALCVLVGMAYAASRRSPAALELADHPFGASAERRRTQATTEPSPAR